MRKFSLVAGLAAAAFIPSLAMAQSSCEQQHGGQVAATVAGAGIGALLGSAVAGRGNHTTGALIGGVGGAIVGNQAGKPSADCAHAYGYYDHNSQWHANVVDRREATGYYDRDGAWIDGAPNGYYEGDRWVSARASTDAAGYTDSRGRWIPSSANGYYDDGGAWVATVSGHYDERGRWVAGQTAGAYDAQGRWMPGARSGHTNSQGAWVADPQPGYYDAAHVWRAGQANGYYDAQGQWQWIGRTNGVSYETSNRAQGMYQDLGRREAWLDQRIRNAAADGSLDGRTSRQDLRELQSIRRSEATFRSRNGRLSNQDQAYLQARLDSLDASVRASRN